MRLMIRGFAALLLLATPCLAQPQPELPALLGADALRAQDHALTRRYQGSFLLGQASRAFDELVLPSAAAIGATYANDKRFGETIRAQGRVTRSLYVTPAGRSTLEVHANFRDELAGKGFLPVFDCAAAACGESFLLLSYRWDAPTTHVFSPGYPSRRMDLIRASLNAATDLRYTLMKRTENGADTYVAITTARNNGGGFGDLSAALNDRVQALVEVVEPRPMELRMETVAAAEMQNQIAANGRVVLYAVQFDFDRATLKPESEAQLAEMARFLQANPAVRAFVTGHTDSQGALDYNLRLSQQRADAVVQALVQRHRIAANRLAARGLGQLAPLASNRTEDGKARNRRVELVEM